MSTAPLTLDVLADAAAVARRAAEWLHAAALAQEGRIAVALSGGSTPRRLYQLLATPPWLDSFPWARTHWFWGDERFVPPEDPESNYRMAREAMLERAPVPPANIHPIPTQGMTPAQAAARYESELMSFYGTRRLAPGRPLFAAVLLGLGTNGHTASLFPGTAALGETEHWTAAVETAEPKLRITLTYPALESCRQAAFLVTGAEKREILARLRQGGGDFPAARLRPSGALFCFADRAAAGD